MHLTEADRAFMAGLASQIAAEFCVSRGLPDSDAAELAAKIGDAVTVCVETKVAIVARRRAAFVAALRDG